ncbi:hypothetical protein ASE04_04365 [Rhizobium sp. Root708]|nr:hypothetical protein ASE04_04365 [Rhizobium sp. Root708]
MFCFIASRGGRGDTCLCYAALQSAENAATAMWLSSLAADISRIVEDVFVSQRAISARNDRKSPTNFGDFARSSH